MGVKVNEIFNVTYHTVTHANTASTDMHVITYPTKTVQCHTVFYYVSVDT